MKSESNPEEKLLSPADPALCFSTEQEGQTALKDIKHIMADIKAALDKKAAFEKQSGSDLNEQLMKCEGEFNDAVEKLGPARQAYEEKVVAEREAHNARHNLSSNSVSRIEIGGCNSPCCALSDALSPWLSWLSSRSIGRCRSISSDWTGRTAWRSTWLGGWTTGTTGMGGKAAVLSRKTMSAHLSNGGH